MLREFTVPARSGAAFEIKQGETVTVIDLNGMQVVDFFAVAYAMAGSVRQLRLLSGSYLKRHERLICFPYKVFQGGVTEPKRRQWRIKRGEGIKRNEQYERM